MARRGFKSRFNRFGTVGGDGSDFLFFSGGKHF
jgi:hypothetical protein